MKKTTTTKKTGTTKTGAVNLKTMLANANKHLKKAKKRASEERGFEEFEDGRYKARLVDISVEKSQASNRTQMKSVWEFLDGEYEGKQKFAYQGMDSEDNLVFALKDLDRLGYDVSEIEDLASELPEILAAIKKEKPVAKIQLKTKGDFQNVYINQLLDDEDLDDDSDQDEDEEEEAPKKKRGKKVDDEEEEESDDDDDDADEDEDEEESDDADDEDGDEDEEESDDEDESEDEDGDTDEEDIEVRVGSNVTVQTKAGKKKGEVLDVLEDENAIRVKVEGGKTLKLSAEKIISVDDVPDEPKASKKKPVAKKKPVGKKK